MTNQPIDEIKDFLKKGVLLVCSALAIYAFCCILVTTGSVIWAREDRKIMNANATSTAVAHGTELAQYEIIDTFDVNVNRWEIGAVDNEFWKGSRQVASGVYIWYVKEVKKGFISRASFKGHANIENYAIYVDTKLETASTKKTCSGLIFRVSSLGWSRGGYAFMTCNAGYFIVYYHNTQDGYDEIHSQYDSTIKPLDWNRLEVLVSGNHFVFLINNQVVYEMDDSRQPTGGAGLLINANDSETKIFFDNFGFQSH